MEKIKIRGISVLNIYKPIVTTFALLGLVVGVIKGLFFLNINPIPGLKEVRMVSYFSIFLKAIISSIFTGIFFGLFLILLFALFNFICKLTNGINIYIEKDKI